MSSKIWFFLLFTLVLAGCTAVPDAEINTAVPTRTATATAEVAVTTLAVTTGPTPTPVVCTAVPPGMLIRIIPVTTQSFDLDIAGLVPGEILHLIMTRQAAGAQMIIEQTFDGRPAASDGRFTSRERLPEPLPDGSNAWQMQLIHARGVACLAFALPSQTTFQVAGATPTPSPPQPTQSSTNTDWNAASWNDAPVISADGRFIAFISNGWLLTETPDVRPWRLFSAFVYDRDAQNMDLVSKTMVGGAPFDNINQVTLSGDGRVIAYYSNDSTIVANDPDPCSLELFQDGCEDLFIYDRDTGASERIDLERVVGVSGDYTVGLSFDGRFVAYDEVGKLIVYDRQSGQIRSLITTANTRSSSFGFQFTQAGDLVFVSYADNLVPDDNNDTADVFIWLMETDEVKRLSVASDGTEANDISGDVQFIDEDLPAIAVSDDGRYIAFTSIATNLTSDPINECEDGIFAEQRRPCHNLYLHDRQTGQTRLVTHNNNGDSRSPALSSDGRYLVFVSGAQNLVDIGGGCAGDSFSTCAQVYLYDSQTDMITLVSQGLDGLPGNSGSLEADISGDGRIIVFTSTASNLIPDDTTSQSDIFIYTQGSRKIECISLPVEKVTE